jgi:serine/threonine protein phosphatase PrpC
MTLILRTTKLSDPGLVRSNNEDTAYAGDRLIVVADGVGGLPAGEVASEIAVRVLAALDATPVDDALAALRDAIGTANREIRAAAGADPASEGMGTTVTAALLTGDQLTVVHVGDSRCYLLRHGTLRRLTRDDTFVQALVDQGVLTPEQARQHPQRSLVTQVVRGEDLAPSLSTLTAEPDDRLLICSDGLSDVVPDPMIGQSLLTYHDRDQCAEQLVKLAHQGGAPDNITVVLADVLPAAG